MHLHTKGKGNKKRGRKNIWGIWERQIQRGIIEKENTRSSFSSSCTTHDTIMYCLLCCVHILTSSIWSLASRCGDYVICITCNSKQHGPRPTVRDQELIRLIFSVNVVAGCRMARKLKLLIRDSNVFTDMQSRSRPQQRKSSFLCFSLSLSPPVSLCLCLFLPVFI